MPSACAATKQSARLVSKGEGPGIDEGRPSTWDKWSENDSRAPRGLRKPTHSAGSGRRYTRHQRSGPRTRARPVHMLLQNGGGTGEQSPLSWSGTTSYACGQHGGARTPDRGQCREDVLRTIAADSATSVWLRIFLSPGRALRLNPKSAGGDRPAQDETAKRPRWFPTSHIELMPALGFGPRCNGMLLARPLYKRTTDQSICHKEADAAIRPAVSTGLGTRPSSAKRSIMIDATTALFIRSSDESRSAERALQGHRSSMNRALNSLLLEDDRRNARNHAPRGIRLISMMASDMMQMIF